MPVTPIECHLVHFGKVPIVGQTIAAKDAHILIPRTCDYVNLYGMRLCRWDYIEDHEMGSYYYLSEPSVIIKGKQRIRVREGGLKMKAEVGGCSQKSTDVGFCRSLRGGKWILPIASPEGKQPGQHLDFVPVRPTSRTVR